MGAAISYVPIETHGPRSAPLQLLNRLNAVILYTSLYEWKCQRHRLVHRTVLGNVYKYKHAKPNVRRTGGHYLDKITVCGCTAIVRVITAALKSISVSYIQTLRET